MKKRIAVSIILTPDLESSRVLMVQRNEKLVFFGGYAAFPGGTLDGEDERVAATLVRDAENAADPDYGVFVAAAARELFEETGVWMGRGDALPAPQLGALRKQMLAGEIRFAEILQRRRQFLDGRDFTPVCRITTPPFTLTRYDTWFLRCRVPPGERVEIWPGELDSGRFMEAGEVLEKWKSGELLVVPPVVIMLRELAGRNCETFLPRVRELTASYDRGKLHHVHFTCGILLAPLATRTRPPATHTNAYLVGEERMYLIDPGPTDPGEQEKLWELLDELLEEGRSLEGILLTHSHPDHTGAVAPCRQRYDLPLYAHRSTADRLSHLRFDGELKQGGRLELGRSPDGRPDWRLEVYHVPGHDPGHLAFRETRYRALLVGDLISTLSPILVDPSEGRLAEYMESLHLAESLAEGHVYPAHGPPMRDGRRAIRKTIRHRQEREGRILRALEKGSRDLDSLLEEVYADVPRKVWPLARRSLLSGLIKLAEESRVEERDDAYRLTGQ